MKNLKKLMAFLLAVVMVLSLVACGNNDQPENNQNAENNNQQQNQPENKDQPENNEPVDKSNVNIELFVVNPWASRPVPEVDPYAQKVGELFGGNWKLTMASEGETELVTRITAENTPDLIAFSSANQLKMFYEEGALLEDWTPYEASMPNFMEAMGSVNRSLLTSEDGKLIGLGSNIGGQNWGWCIRQDWLDNLNLSMPTNAEELLNVMRAFTKDDPDGNGKDDTYGFTAAGSGGGIGELAKFVMMFSDPNFYVNGSGEVSHAFLDGTYLDFLHFAKTIIDEGLIDPNYYTIGWDERKPDLYAGKYGICYYPPAALMSELEAAGADESFINAWTVMDTCGGKLEAATQTSENYFAVSVEAAADPVKMEIICDFLERTTGLTDEFLAVYGGVGIEEGWTATRNDDGTVYIYKMNNDTAIKTTTGTFGWGQARMNRTGSLIQGTTETPSEWVSRGASLSAELDKMDRWSGTFQMLSPDATIAADAGAVAAQFEIQYLMGQKTDADYDAFVKSWLAAGGQDLLDNAIETYKAYGFI